MNLIDNLLRCFYTMIALGLKPPDCNNWGSSCNDKWYHVLRRCRVLNHHRQQLPFFASSMWSPFLCSVVIFSLAFSW
jgi:hypothetical protein